MIAYFDTSALLPLLIEEAGSLRAGRVWDEAEHVTSVRLVYAEARAALAQAVRTERLDAERLAETVASLDDLYAHLDRIDVDDRLVRRAGGLAEAFGLRGYDAVHLASAEQFAADESAVLVSGDRALSAAATSLGLAVTDTSDRSERGQEDPGR